MYSRYRQPAWETTELAEAPPVRRRSADSGRGPRPRGEVSPGLARARLLPVVDLLGVKLHAITELACIGHILEELDAGRGGVVVTPNLDHLRRYKKDVNFGALIAEADLVVADGMPLVWASRLQGTPLPERVAGSNLISTLSSSAAERGRSIFLLGGSEGTADGAARVLSERFPKLKIVGRFYPPVGFEHDQNLMAEIISMLSASKPDIVYVALGSPKQERLIARLKQILPGSWWLGVGNSFSFLCGDVKRAPLWMQKSGLEWVHRLVQEPRRLFKRYLMVGVPFATQLLVRATVRGVPNRVLRRRRPLPAIPAGIPAVGLAAAEAVAEVAKLPAEGLLPEAPIGISTSIETQLARTAWPAGESERSEESTPLARLRALVLLGGSVRANALCGATGRAMLDLPLNESGSILNFWLSQAGELARAAGLEKLGVRVMMNQNSPEPFSADARYAGVFRVERDLSEYRGTGGVLRDLASDYQDDDLILVANASQILLDPLTLIVTALQRKRGDVSVISHDDGTPSGIMLVSCKTLRMLPASGFIDMKEQGLPLIATKFDVRVVKRRRPTGLPVRSLEAYIQAMHYYHSRRVGATRVTDPLAEDFSPSFSLIEPGATVDPTARVHDSVVLAGGKVESGAVLVRSIVCPGGVVRRDRTAVDQLVILDGDGKKSPRVRAAAIAVVAGSTGG